MESITIDMDGSNRQPERTRLAVSLERGLPLGEDNRAAMAVKLGLECTPHTIGRPKKHSKI